MKYPRILAAIRSARWAVTPSTLQAIRDTLAAHVSGRMSSGAVRPRAGDEDDYDDDEGAAPFEILAPGVACVQLCGIIGKNLSSMEMLCGGCDLARVESNLMQALASPMVASVILRIDSPGGTVGGVAEFAQRIKALSAESGKPVWAFIDGQGCSAAYWIACGCTAITCTPSADVGSIGVYMALVDESANWADEGFKLVLIKAGAHKAAGIAGSEITAEQIALWQADVDYIYGQFTDAVRASRPAVSDETMQGQCFYGSRALAAGLVDQVTPSLEAMVATVAPVSPFTLSPAA